MGFSWDFWEIIIANKLQVNVRKRLMIYLCVGFDILGLQTLSLFLLCLCVRLCEKIEYFSSFNFFFLLFFFSLYL